jgi:uncharacterized membrane protein YeiB
MTQPTALTADASTSVDAPSRWNFLDALRGIAIAGILFVNIPDITGLGSDRPPADGTSPSEVALRYAAQTRFVPIFTFLFGMSLVFVVRAARARQRRPWLALILRLVTLLAIGLLHTVVYPGEILTTYAVVGLLILPVVLLVPRLVQAVLAVALIAAAFVLAGGGVLTTFGLMLLGAAAAAYGWPRVLDRADRRVGWVFAGALIAAVPALWWQTTQPGDPRFTLAGSVAGLVTAVAYVSGLSLGWATRARRTLSAVFQPIGRMALTNYVGASLVIFPVGRWLDFASAPTPAPAIGLALVLIVGQSVLSRLWLTRFSYGPVEWVWRVITWRERVPLTATGVARGDGGPRRC